MSLRDFYYAYQARSASACLVFLHLAFVWDVDMHVYVCVCVCVPVSNFFSDIFNCSELHTTTEIIAYHSFNFNPILKSFHLVDF